MAMSKLTEENKIALVDRLTVALKQQSQKYFLNIKNLEIVAYSNTFDEADEILEQIELEPDAYIEIILPNNIEDVESFAANWLATYGF